MTSWIMTGGMGCGKSTVCRLLQEHLSDAVFFSSDDEVRILLGRPDVMRALKEAFGPAAISEGDGNTADRDWLRTVAFRDPDRRKRLEAILHPEVLKALETRRRQARIDGSANLFLAEVPLHYEIGATVSADLVIVVAASRAIQVKRLMARRGLDEPTIHQMLRAQWPIDAKVERADVVIWNDGDPAALEAQVLTLAREHWTE